MKIAAIILLVIVLVVIGAQLYSFFVQEHQLNADLADIQTQLTKSKTDETNLQEEVQYLANPLNFQKELRAQFNYKKTGETMIIIVPPGTSTSTDAQE